MSDRIYALVDPRSEDVRYIGKTSKPLSERLAKHLGIAQRGNGTHLLHWLRQLLDEGLMPGIHILEEVGDDVSWQQRERFWIAACRAVGWPLVNATAGGDGLTEPSPSVRRKLAEAARGKRYAAGKRSKAFRQRMAGVAPLTRNALGHVVSEEAKQQIGESLKRYFRNGGESVRGEKQGQSKLTEDQVRTIRQQYAGGGVSMRALGSEYGVCHETIRKIVRRQAWQHIT